MLSPIGHDTASSERRGNRTVWVALVVLLAVGIVTRFLFLGRIYLWIDETAILQERLWADAAHGLRGFLKDAWLLSRNVHAEFTYNGAWTAVVYLVCKALGSTDVWCARLPSAISGVLLLPVLFGLGRQVSGSSFAGLVAAGAAALSITQILYAQQVSPYGPAMLAGALVIWAAVAWCDRLDKPRGQAAYAPEGFLFFGAVAGAAVLHNCTLPVIVSSWSILLANIIWQWRRGDMDRRRAVHSSAALLQAGLVIAGCVVVFVLPKAHEGFRGYLASYYAPADGYAAGGALRAVPAVLGFGLSRAYDLATYSMNTIYHDRWYQPLALNPLTLVPVAIAFVGFISLWRGPRKQKTFALLTTLSVLVVFVGALARRYPFGGVRQCLPLTVFVYVSAGIGLSILYRRARPLAIGLVVAWVAIALAALPQFYTKRLSPYDTKSLIAYARTTGSRCYVTVNDWGNPEHTVLLYHLRNHPDIRVLPLLQALEGFERRRKPFILASTTQSLDRLRRLAEDAGQPRVKERVALIALLAHKGVRVTPLAEMAVNEAPPRIQEDNQSIYTPLNGVFLYKVDWDDLLETGNSETEHREHTPQTGGAS